MSARKLAGKLKQEHKNMKSRNYHEVSPDKIVESNTDRLRDMLYESVSIPQQTEHNVVNRASEDVSASSQMF